MRSAKHPDFVISKEKLDECTQELETSRSDVVRKGIDMVHDSLKK